MRQYMAIALIIGMLPLTSFERGRERRKASKSDSPASIEYRSFDTFGFSVMLPAHFNIKPQNSESSRNYCDYDVRTPRGAKVIELHSLLKSRFSTTSIRELYAAALRNDDYSITYNTQKGNWFVVSGYRVENGNEFYWRRAVGEDYISDLFIEYTGSMESQIEPFIPNISKSFVSY